MTCVGIFADFRSYYYANSTLSRPIFSQQTLILAIYQHPLDLGR